MNADEEGGLGFWLCYHAKEFHQGTGSQADNKAWL